jgi:AraC-like DNA-binding protein
MEVTTLNLYGQAFADCLSMDSSFRGNQLSQDDACLAYVGSGTSEIYSPSGKIIVKDGESILMKCGNYITGVVGATPTSVFQSVIFHMNLESIKKAFIGKDIGFLKVDNESKKVDPSLKIGHSLQMESFIASLTLYFDNPKLVKDEIMALKLQELVYILCDSGKNPVATQIIGSLHSTDQLAFDDIIAANMYSGLSISELAHLSARSESTFKRDFKKWYKESPAKYFKAKKLQKAAGLLKNTTLQVNEIAWDCGFENAAHFGTSFLSFYGQTPKEYRA